MTDSRRIRRSSAHSLRRIRPCLAESASAEAAAHRHAAAAHAASAHQQREDHRQHARRGAAAVLLILLHLLHLLTLRLVSLRAGRQVVLIILDRAGRSIGIGAAVVVRHRIARRDAVDGRVRAAAAAGQFRTDLDSIVDDQRRILQIVARLLLGVGLAEVARDEAEKYHLLAAARTGDDLCTDQRQRVSFQIIGEALALRRIDRAAGDGAGRRGRGHARARIETARASQLRPLGHTIWILHGLARSQARESRGQPEGREGICDATHTGRIIVRRHPPNKSTNSGLFRFISRETVRVARMRYSLCERNLRPA